MPLDFSDRAVPAPLDFSNRAVSGDTAAPPAPAGFKGQTPVADLVSAQPQSAIDRFLNNTAIGRVMAAFGQGAEEGFGDDPLGLSDETAEEMRRIGLFPKVNEGISGSLKLFNETLIRPAAAGLDAIMRGAEAVAVGTAVAAGQVAEELGATETQGRRLSRDVLMLADTVGVLTGTSPTAIRRIRGREVKPKVQGAEMPELPTELYDKSDVAVVDKAGNINLDRIQAPEDVKDVIRQAASESGIQAPAGVEFPPPRRDFGVTLRDNGAMMFKPIVDDAGQQVGSMVGRVGAEEVRLLNVGIDDEAAQGRGFGLRAYQDVADFALSQGKVLASDSEVTLSAARVYDALERRGYVVERNPDAKIENVDGEQKWVAKAPVFRVVKGPERAPLSPADPGFMEARRGVMTFADTEALAEAAGVRAQDLMNRKVGQAMNAEEALWFRKALVQSATKVRELAVKAVGGSDKDLMAFQEAVTRHMTIQEQVAGLTAEAGRALSSFRILARGTEEAKDLGHVIEALGGRDNIETVARAIRELDTPGQVSKFVMDTRRGEFKDMVVEAWINALLSGPRTHSTNVLSNALTAIWGIPETAVAATIGGVRRAVGVGDDSVRFGEVGARTFGLVQGAREGIIAGWRAFKTELPTDATAKIETRIQKAIPSKRVSIGGFEFEIGGRQLRIPGRALLAADEFFKAIGYRQELNALAYRQAAKEGLRGADFERRVAELVNHPTAEMTRKARDAAEEQTFTNPLGKSGRAIQILSNNSVLGKVIITFVRTPTNILKFSGTRSPLAPFSKKVRDNLMGKNGPVARDTQAARILVGSAVAAAGASLAAEGYITGGGPQDPAQRALLYATGWQPYSVKIGDVYYSYQRLEPLATLLGVSADMYEIASAADETELVDIGNWIVASISENLLNKSFMQGPANLIQAVTDFDRYGERYIQRELGTIIPTGVAQVAQVQDPYLREARTALDVLKSRLPGLSTDLLPRRDIWGEPIELGGSLGPDLLSPIFQSRLNNDPVNQELLELGIYPAKLDRKIRGVELTPEQYDEYQRLAGRFAKYQLDGLVALEGWRDLPPFARREAIANTIRKARETARSLMLMRHPGIIEEATRARVKEITGSANLP